jgi:hypothetical protein
MPSALSRSSPMAIATAMVEIVAIRHRGRTWTSAGAWERSGDRTHLVRKIHLPRQARVPEPTARASSRLPTWWVPIRPKWRRGLPLPRGRPRRSRPRRSNRGNGALGSEPSSSPARSRTRLPKTRRKPAEQREWLDARSRPPCLGPCNREAWLVKPGSSAIMPEEIASSDESPWG